MGRLLIVLALLAVACGGSQAGSTIAPSAGTATTSAPSSSPTEDQVVAQVEQAPVEGSVGSAPAETQSTTTRVRPDGPDAPDFVLTLGPGGEFSLSDEQRPVYVVFWAEW